MLTYGEKEHFYIYFLKYQYFVEVILRWFWKKGHFGHKKLIFAQISENINIRGKGLFKSLWKKWFLPLYSKMSTFRGKGRYMKKNCFCAYFRQHIQKKMVFAHIAENINISRRITFLPIFAKKYQYFEENSVIWRSFSNYTFLHIKSRSSKISTFEKKDLKN